MLDNRFFDAGDFICLTGGLCDAGDYMLDRGF